MPDALSCLNSVVVEPSWQTRLACRQRDPSDAEMSRLWARGESSDGRFCIRGSGDTALLIRIPAAGPE